MWASFRRKRLDGYLKAKEKGEIDADIIPLLDLINSFEHFVTLSSCSGRIAVMDVPSSGDKLNSVFLGKWHQPVGLAEVKSAAEKCKWIAWLMQNPPILHVACTNLHWAKRLMNAANEAGFRRSGLISLNHYVVEIASLERLEMPIGEKGKLLVNDDYLSFSIRHANEKLLKGKEKLKKLHQQIKAFSE
jgi:tRNA wybutosine-synthesizing protein 3